MFLGPKVIYLFLNRNFCQGQSELYVCWTKPGLVQMFCFPPCFTTIVVPSFYEVYGMRSTMTAPHLELTALSTYPPAPSDQRPPRRGRFIKREQPIRKSSRGGAIGSSVLVMWPKKVLHFKWYPVNI